MANITIGQIGACFGLVVGIIGSIEFMYSRLKKWLKLLISSEMAEVKTSVTEIDIAQSKNFLVRCFNDLEDGRKLNRETVMRMHEVYDRYTNVLHQNSYIHERMDKLKEEEKI